MTLKLALLKVSLSDLLAQWSLLYSTTQPYATLHRSHLHAPYLVERRLSHTHSHARLQHLYLYLRKVLLGVRLRDSTLTLHQRRAAKRTRLINYQVECPVSKFDLEHKFRYSGELSSTLCTYGILVLCMYRLVYRVVYLCWLFRTRVCVFNNLLTVVYLRAAMRYECRTWIRLLLLRRLRLLTVIPLGRPQSVAHVGWDSKTL